ncbi:MAG TPA: hypothetical protein VEK57_18845 [Thermoanaerobaculia bacterium]|nr:hypothetical protein [Thermoanaerobaculia bacterium]
MRPRIEATHDRVIVNQRPRVERRRRVGWPGGVSPADGVPP